MLPQARSKRLAHKHGRRGWSTAAVAFMRLARGTAVGRRTTALPLGTSCRFEGGRRGRAGRSRSCQDSRSPSWYLNHVERHALASELDGMDVAHLVRREATPETPASVDEAAGFDPQRLALNQGPSADRAVDEQNSGPPGSSRRAASHGSPAAPSPRRPCRSRGGDRPCRCATSSEPRRGRGRVRPAPAPPLQGRRAGAPRSQRAAYSRHGRCWPRASRRRSLPRSANRRDRAAP